MIITPDALKALKTTFQKNFQDGLATPVTTWQEVATLIQSTTASNTYGWLGQWPQLIEWIGDRQIKDMAAHAYAIVNKHYESTIGVKRNDIEDDNVGVYAPIFTESGRAAAMHPEELVYGLLKQAHAVKCYDGQNFFDTDHPVAAGVDGTGAVATVSNLYGGAATEPAWYLLDNSRALKPLIFQERKKIKLTSMTDEDDESVFMRNEFRYGLDGRCNVGVGFWQMAARSTAALSADSFAEAYTGMTSLKADGGRPLAVRPTHIVVPVGLEDAAKALINAEKIGGEYNVHKNKVKVIASPFL